MGTCPKCQRQFGKRKRCYFCTGRQRTGEQRTCPVCGSQFYAAPWQLRDTERRQGTYCSVACKGKALEGVRPPWARPEEATRHSAGYVLVWAPDHPRAHGGRVFEHILVMEQAIGRLLLPGEFVHHVDRNRTNNDLGNLEVRSNSEHAALHALTNPQCQPRGRRVIRCAECGQEFEVMRYQAESSDPQSRRKYCSLACRHRSWGRQMKALRAARRAEGD